MIWRRWLEQKRHCRRYWRVAAVYLQVLAKRTHPNSDRSGGWASEPLGREVGRLRAPPAARRAADDRAEKAAHVGLITKTAVESDLAEGGVIAAHQRLDAL